MIMLNRTQGLWIPQQCTSDSNAFFGKNDKSVIIRRNANAYVFVHQITVSLFHRPQSQTH